MRCGRAGKNRSPMLYLLLATTIYLSPILLFGRRIDLRAIHIRRRGVRTPRDIAVSVLAKFAAGQFVFVLLHTLRSAWLRNSSG